MDGYKTIQRIFCIEEDKIDQALIDYPNAFLGGIAVVTYNDVYVEDKNVADYDTYSRFVKKFQDKGIEVQVNYSVSIGHGDELYDKKLPKNYATMVDYNGNGCMSCACPRDSAFRTHLQESVKRYAKVKPSVFWIDDDFRLSYHGHVRYACFCESCIKKFNEQYNGCWTRESLKDALAQNTDLIRQSWQAFNRQALVDLAKLIADTVHKIDDGIIIGFMQANGSVVEYEAVPTDKLIQVAKNKNGEVWFRHGSGFYSDNNPYEIVYKNIEIARLCARAVNTPYKVVNLTEEVTSPYVRRSKSMKITLLESIMNIGVAGADGVMYEGIKPNLTEQLMQGNLVATIHENYEYFLLLKGLIKGKKQKGVYAYYPLDIWDYNDSVPDMNLMNNMGANDWYNLFLLGIPFTFKEEDAGVLLCSGKGIRASQKECLTKWISKAVYADGCAVLEMEKKIGNTLLGVKSSAYPEEELGGGKTSEAFTSHYLNGAYAGFLRYNIMSNATKGSACLESTGAEVLSWSMNEREMQAGVIGTAVFENELGGRIAVHSRGAWSNDFLGLAKGEQIKNVFDWLYGGKMPVRVDSVVRVGQSIWEDETERVVFIYNLDYDNATDICVRSDDERNAEILTDTHTWMDLGTGTKWNLPKLDAWTATVLRMKKV